MKKSTISMSIEVNPDPKLFITDYKQWVEGLRNFLFRGIIPKVLPNTNKYRNEYARILISDEAMNIWIVAFTDPSVDRNKDKNYELLELLGDRMLASIFTNYVVSLYPDVTEETLTEINATYMSKTKQKEKSENMGLHKWVRINTDITVHTYEDLFEALFGALFKVGDTLIGKGTGYALCTNLITSLYYDLDIDQNEILSRPITQVKEIFEKLGWGDYQEEKFKPDELGTIIAENSTTGERNKWTLELKLTKNAIKFLMNAKNFEDLKPKNIISGGLLARITESNKKTLKNNAFRIALENLKKYYGIDFKWAESFAEKRLNDDIERIAKEQMKRDNLIKIYFPKSKKTDKKQFLQLVGINEYDRQEILVSSEGDFNLSLADLKSFALSIYSKYGKQDPTKSIIYNANERIIV